MIKRYIEYAKDNPQGYWFKAKWFGWGWTPVTRQGWFITGLYLLFIVFLSNIVDESSSFNEILLPFIIPATVATAIFLYVAYKKGEKPRWQWMPPKKSSKNNYTAE